MQALWMLAAAFFFASMGVCVKFGSTYMHSFELVFYRGLVGIVFMGLWARALGVSLRTSVPSMHLWRAIIGTFSMASWFYALAHLPLPTAMTLNYMSSVWLAAFVVGGALFFGKSALQQGPLLGTVLASFAGVVLILKPTIEQNQLFAGLVGLLSGMGAALAYMQVKALGQAGEPEARTVFYFSAGSVLVGLLGTAAQGVSEFAWPGFLWVLPLGVFASLGQWCMTRAYSKGATLLVANLQYAGIVFASLFSLALFGDPIAPSGWLGIALIMASGITATALRAKLTPKADHQEPEDR
jgi:S-adenosylmethionine uptake transporter